jgi:hypothetical protein
MANSMATSMATSVAKRRDSRGHGALYTPWPRESRLFATEVAIEVAIEFAIGIQSNFRGSGWGPSGTLTGGRKKNLFFEEQPQAQ